MTSFEGILKSGEVGYCVTLPGVRESVPLAPWAGGEGRVPVLEHVGEHAVKDWPWWQN